MPKIDTYNSKTEKDFFTYSKAISLLEDVKLVHPSVYSPILISYKPFLMGRANPCY